MGQAAHAHSEAGHGNGGHHGGGEHHSPMYYVKIWGLLLVLLIVSLIGPELGNKVLTLITAFGIAIVKALIVAAFFMHLNVEKRYIWYMLYGMLLMVFLFFMAVAPDINKVSGTNWINRSAEMHIKDHPMFAPHEDHPTAAPGATGEPAPAAPEH